MERPSTIMLGMKENFNMKESMKNKLWNKNKKYNPKENDSNIYVFWR